MHEFTRMQSHFHVTQQTERYGSHKFAYMQHKKH